jgi:hypothetical protein
LGCFIYDCTFWNLFFNEKIGGIMKSKKAEITTHQLVLLIVLIIGFVIILFLLFRLNLGKESDSEICHNSVMERATLSKTPLDADTVPLNCQRQYVCITKDGSCEALTKPIKKKVKSEDEIYKVLAEELRNCWWMFGEGNAKFIDNEAIPKNYCSICSQISFDDSVKKDIISSGKIDKKLLYEYMAKTKIPEKKITYSEYLYKTNDLNLIFGEAIKQGAGFGEIDISKTYYAFMVVPTKTNWITWAAGGALVGVVGTIVIGSSIATGGAAVPFWVSVVGTTVGGIVGGSVATPIVQSIFGTPVVPPTLIESPPSKEIEAYSCKDISTMS